MTLQKGEKQKLGLSLTPVAAETTTPPVVTDQPKTWVIATGFGLAAVFAGAGAVLLIVSESKQSEVETLQARVGETGCNNPGADIKSTCDDLASMRDDRKFTGNLGVAGLVAGGVVATGTAAYWLWPRSSAGPQPAASSKVTFAPMAGPTHGGAFVTGRW